MMIWSRLIISAFQKDILEILMISGFQKAQNHFVAYRYVLKIHGNAECFFFVLNFLKIFALKLEQLEPMIWFSIS